MAEQVLANVRLGHDPAIDRAKARAEAAITLGTVTDQLLKVQEACRDCSSLLV